MEEDIFNLEDMKDYPPLITAEEVTVEIETKEGNCEPKTEKRMRKKNYVRTASKETRI